MKDEPIATVADFIRRLQEFPPELRVFLCTDEASGIAHSVGEVAMNLVNRKTGKIIEDEGDLTIPDGFADSLVIHARQP